MKNYKRLLSLVLLLAMVLSLGTAAFAEDLETAAEESGMTPPPMIRRRSRS